MRSLEEIPEENQRTCADSLPSSEESKQTEPTLMEKAIQCIDFICLIECRDDDDDKAMAMIHEFAHCVNESFTCHDTHNSWRQELEKFWQDLKDRGEV